MAPSGSSSSSLATIQVPIAFEPLFRPARYKAVYGGRGSAKSHTFATALVTTAAERPLRVLCCREIQGSIRDSVKRLLDDKIKQHNLDGFYRSTDTEIRGPNDSLFVFAGLRTHVDSIKSMEGIDVAWVEEAHRVAQRSLDILIPTVRKPGSELWFSWNPEEKTDPVDTLFRGANPPPNSFIREVSWHDNPWFPDVLRREMEFDRRRDLDKYLHIWKGQYKKQSQARVFKNWRIGAETEFQTNDNTVFRYGGDWGFAEDPSVLLRSYIDGNSLYIDAEAYEIGCDIDFTPFLFGGSDNEELKNLNADAVLKAAAAGRRWEGVPGATRWPIIADSARPETIRYMQQHGFPQLEGARKGPGSVEDGISFLKKFNIVIHPRCRHTIDEFTYHSYKIDKLTGAILPILEDKRNHCIDSLRYALERVMKNKKLVWW